MQTKSHPKTVRDLKDIRDIYDRLKASQVDSKSFNLSTPSRNNALDLLNSPVDKTIAIYGTDSSKSNSHVKLTVTKVRS